jgi:hypothetical protein
MSNISEEHSASIFRVKQSKKGAESGGIILLWNISNYLPVDMV